MVNIITPSALPLDNFITIDEIEGIGIDTRSWPMALNDEGRARLGIDNYQKLYDEDRLDEIEGDYVVLKERDLLNIIEAFINTEKFNIDTGGDTKKYNNIAFKLNDIAYRFAQAKAEYEFEEPLIPVAFNEDENAEMYDFSESRNRWKKVESTCYSILDDIHSYLENFNKPQDKLHLLPDFYALEWIDHMGEDQMPQELISLPIYQEIDINWIMDDTQLTEINTRIGQVWMWYSDEDQWIKNKFTI